MLRTQKSVMLKEMYLILMYLMEHFRFFKNVWTVKNCNGFYRQVKYILYCEMEIEFSMLRIEFYIFKYLVVKLAKVHLSKYKL